MTPAEIVVVAADAAIAAGLGWWFFGPKKTADAPVAGGVQELTSPSPGEYGFACEMNMIHGVLLVEEARTEAARAQPEGGVQRVLAPDEPLRAEAVPGEAGIVLSPMIAAAAMSASSLSVVTNANRLRRSRIAAPIAPPSAPVAGGDR